MTRFAGSSRSPARSHCLFGAFVVMLATGLTRGELVGLRWNDVDLDAGTIVVRRVVSMTLGQRTESNVSTPRTVTLGEHTIDVLQQHRATSDQPAHDWPVFQKRGGGELNPESMSTMFARLVERAGVTPITIGGFRHTHAAMALRAGVNPLVVSKRLGLDLGNHLRTVPSPDPTGFTTTTSKHSKLRCSTAVRDRRHRPSGVLAHR